MPRSRLPYPAEFRQQIIELARAGRTPAELSNEFGCSAQTVTNWVAQAANARPAESFFIDARRRPTASKAHPRSDDCAAQCA
jgi:transposase-like protein